MTRFDLFGQALWEFYRTGDADLRIERADHYIGDEDVSWYFTHASEFMTIEKRALKFVRGRVLDIGCGAGRHALYLQRKHRVTAIDMSPSIVALALECGVHDARVIDASKRLPFRDGEFDTVIMFGNNLGIGGTQQKLRAMLRELHRVTSPRGRILATTRMPSTTDPKHRSYLRQNLERGRALGQLRLRLVWHSKCGNWFDLLLLAPTDLMQIAASVSWEIAHVFPNKNFEQGYSVVLEKA